MTVAEQKVWEVFLDEVGDAVDKDYKENRSKYMEMETITFHILTLENIIESIGLSWNLKLKLDKSFGIPENSVDGFVNAMVFNAIRNVKNVFFE